MKLIYLSILTLSTLCLAPSVIASNPPSNQSSSLAVNEKSETHQRITDRKIIGIIMAVDKSEIAAANVALKKNVNTSVLDYAKYMHKQHSKNLKQITQLANATGLEPLQSKTSLSMVTEHTQNLKALSALNGVSFETAYIDAMVEGHKGGLKLIDTTLLK